MQQITKALQKIALNKPLSLLCISLVSLVISYIDYINPAEVPTEALNVLPIWMGLLAFGLGGALVTAGLSTILFYFSNYYFPGENQANFLVPLILNLSLYIMFSFAANSFLLNQRKLSSTQDQLKARLEELDHLYTKTQLLNQDNLRLAVIEERNRLAREIHDVLAQGFTAILLQTKAARLNLNNLQILTERLNQIEDLAQHNLYEARRSVSNLRPQSLDGNSLPVALEQKANAFKNEYEVGVKFTCIGTPCRLSNEVETALYRIAQEALANIGKHSQASQVEVDLEYDEDEICLTIADNGQGFDPQEKSENGNGGSFGLSTMQERARLIGGLFTIQSSPGNGCRIRTSVSYIKAEGAVRSEVG